MTPQEACNFPLDLENHYGYVYCVTFPNTKKYVGQSKRPWRYRWKCHHSGTSLCPAMRSALQKYGTEELTWELLTYADSPQELTDKETHYIQTLSTLSPNGYNVTLPRKAYPYPEEKKNRIRLGLALHHLHKTNPDATIEDAKKYIEAQDYENAHRVKKGTPEWIEQCKRVAQKREADLRAKGIFRKHKNTPKRQYNKTDKSWKKEKQETSRLDLITKEIAVYETGEHFFSIVEFCEKYNIPGSSATLCLQKKNKHVHNFHIYPAGISQRELDSYIRFWNRPKQQQTGVLTCVETGKTYNSAQEVAKEQNVLKSRVYLAARFPSRNINGYHFIYDNTKTLSHAL